MRTTNDFYPKFPNHLPQTVRKKLHTLGKERPELAGALRMSQGYAIREYTDQQFDRIIDHFKRNPFQARRGRPALPAEERARRQAERNAKRKTKAKANKKEAGHGK